MSSLPVHRAFIRARQLPRFGLTGKFNAVFMIILVIAGLNILSLRALLAETDGVAETINIAGKLRMLSQKMAFELTLALQSSPPAGEAAVHTTMRDYEVALAALEHGGRVFDLQVPAVPVEMQALTGALRSDWQTYRTHLDGMLGGHRDAAAMAQLSGHAARLLASAERLVGALTRATRKAQQQALFNLYILFGAELLIVGVLVQLVRLRLVSPLLALAQGARALSNRRYDYRVAFHSHDEIGELVENFNAAAQRIGSLVAQIDSEHLQLRQAEAMFRGLAENSIVGVCIVQDLRFVFVNQMLADMFGYERPQLLESGGLLDVVSPEYHATVEENIRRRTTGEVDGVIYEVRGCRRDGSTLDVQVFGSHMQLNGATAMLGVMLDVTTRREQQRQLEYLANHDALTGLANRNLLIDHIQLAIAVANRARGGFAVLLLDLNDFKVINDSLGHSAGDQLLQLVARRLQQSIRDGDTVARFGGDEFVIVMPNIDSAADASVVANKIRDLLATPFAIAEQDIFVHASIGIALYPHDGDAEALIKNADLAMYRAKREQRGGFRFYSEELNQRNQQRLDIERELHHAAVDGSLQLEYQPKVCLNSGRIVGAEALLRWNHPHLGRVMPLDFIPLAEETGHIIAIGAWVIDTACAQLRKWMDMQLPIASVAVNVSGKQLRHHDLPHYIQDTLTRYQLAATHLEIELTESVLMDQHEEVIATIKQLRSSGMQLAMDDFGTGYSSLTYLKRFPFDQLKLDKSFISDINTGRTDAAIVQTVLSLGRAFGLRTVAEGVETETQLQFLIAHGCDQGQGYLFSPPLTPDAFAELLRTRGGFALPN